MLLNFNFTKLTYISHVLNAKVIFKVFHLFAACRQVASRYKNFFFFFTKTLFQENLKEILRLHVGSEYLFGAFQRVRAHPLPPQQEEKKVVKKFFNFNENLSSFFLLCLWRRKFHSRESVRAMTTKSSLKIFSHRNSRKYLSVFI